MKNISKLLVLITLSLLVSCATIIRGGSQVVTINSNVDGATIAIDGDVVGKTPFNGKISRSADTMILSKDGFKSKTIIVQKDIQTMFFGYFISGGLFGSSTDMSTGAMYVHSSNNFQVDLEEAGNL